MSNKMKIMMLITVLFLGCGGILYAFDMLMAAECGSPMSLPYPLLSLLLLLFLLLALLGLTHIHLEQTGRVIENYRESLDQKIYELENTQNNLEEIVQKRTFEISVINASLNREIAERIQAERESNKLKNRFQLILNSAGEGIFGLDKEGRVTFLNKAASLMLGWEVEDLIGKSHHGLIHHTRKDGGHYRVEDCPIHEAYRDGIVHARSDEIFWTKGGNSFPVEYYSTPIIENKQIVGAVVVFRDLSLQVHARAKDD